MHQIYVLLLALVIVVILILTYTSPHGPIMGCKAKSQMVLYTAQAPPPSTGDWAQVTCGALLYSTYAAAAKAVTKPGAFVQAVSGGRFRVCQATLSPLPDCPDCPACVCPACPSCPACNCPAQKDCPTCPACPQCPTPKCPECPACNCPQCPKPECPPQPITFTVQGNVQPTA